MEGKVLVTYGSWCGSTAEVAAEIGVVLRGNGLDVEVLPAGKVRDAAQYGAAVIGTAIRAGRCKGEVTKFVGRNEQDLRRMPVAVFSVGLGMSEDTQENRNEARRFLKPITDRVEPVSVGTFGGASDAARARFPMRLIISRMPQGDWRDWDAIREWAAELSDRLQE